MKILTRTLPLSLFLAAAARAAELAAPAFTNTPSTPGDPALVSTPSSSGQIVQNAQPISLEGTLTPVREVRMASRSKGVIRFISEEGDRVRAGDPILILEDSQEKLEVNRQQKILELRTVEESDEEQLRRKDVDSPLELAEKKLNLDLAQINVEQAENLLSLRTTKAPFDGVITQRFRSAGEAADELSPVLTMVDVNNLYLECHLPAEMRNRIREGQSVSIQVDTPASAEAQGRVQLCSPVIDPASGDFEVRVLIPNAGGALMAGVRARGIIAATEQEGHQTPQSPSTSQIPAVPVTAGSP